ncbi:MAG: prolyl-tRNA synthetase associated domain-containing protein [Oscillospiraceae bacterium]|nr:prolyl-tRNA synthetase associated domain-containing protein [Oscillospiraceae bacterium]
MNNETSTSNGDDTAIIDNNKPAASNYDESTARKDEVYQLLDRLGIEYKKIDHPPMFTQADHDDERDHIDTVIFKNLFLRNKDKSRYYLLSLPLTKRADLVKLAQILGETRLSFGDEDALMQKLNIKHGSVSFLNVVGARGTDATILIDDAAFDCETIGIHPNDNTATVIIKPQDIEKILNACGVEYRILTLK